MRYLVVLTLALLWLPGAAGQGRSTDAVVLVTLDGVRTEEIFGGLDTAVLASTLRDDERLEHTADYRRFWAPTPEERRRKLMPFFWSLVTDQGAIAGDPAAGSVVRLTNGHRFSYPGYAELLLGEAHDTVIASNNFIRNPYVTVLEVLRERLALPRAQVATFASWGVFNAIVEHREGATITNAGLEAGAGGSAEVASLNRLQQEARPSWADVRYDVFTFRQAMAHFAAARPRVVYLAFDETDDWAHDGRYDRVLDTLARTDNYLRELWTWVQAQPDYRGRTHLLITTDHGRGHTPADWRDHGAKVAGAERVWIALVSPRLPRRGLWRDHPPLSTNQVAATLAKWMGVDWNALRPAAGRPLY